MCADDLYRKFFHFTLIFAAITICYANSLNSSWHFDDFSNIVSNQNIQIQKLSWKEIQNSFYSPESKKLSRPVANLTFAINYLISGLDTTSYHVFNVLVHICASWFVYLIFLQTLRLYYSVNAKDYLVISLPSIALLGTILWALHPINTQAVTYIVQRMASLGALFYYVAFYCYISFRLSNESWRKIIFLLFTICFFSLGIGTKENIVTLPLALVGYEIAFFRSSILPSSRNFKYIVVIGSVTFSLLLLTFFYEKIIDIFNPYFFRTFTPWERVISQPLILSRYLFLIFYPLADFLILETDMVASHSLLDPPVTLVAILFATSLIIFSIVYLKKYSILCFAIYYYFVNHMIESTIIPLELYFEHRNYLPSIFIFMAIAFYFIKLICYYSDNNKVFMKYIIIFTLVVFIVGEGNATHLRNEVYRDEISLHKDTIKKAPINPRPYVAIASQLIRSKQYEEALEYLRDAESLYEKYPNRFQENWIAKLYYNAGIVYRIKGDNEKAIKLFFKSLQLDRAEWITHVNLGILFFDQGDYEHAEDYLFNAVSLHPNCPSGLYNLFGRALYANKKYDEALDVFLKGLKINEMKVLRYNLAATYLKMGQLQSAKSEILKVLSQAYNNDGVYLLYRAVIFSDKDREKSIQQIASMLISSQYDYCDWISVIIENKSRDVIFPDIYDFKDQLKEAYRNEIAKIRNQIIDQVHKVESCNFTPLSSLD